MNHSDRQKQLAVFDSLLDDLSRSACELSVSSSRFFAQVLKSIASAITAQGAAIIARGPESSWILIAGNSRAKEHVTEWIQRNPAAHDESELQPNNSNIKLFPIVAGLNNWGAMLLEVSASLSPTQHQMALAIVEIIVEHLTTQLNHQASVFQDLCQRYTQHVHSSLNPDWVAQHIANDGRMLLGCERVSIYLRRQGRMKLSAVSSIGNLEKRSEILQRQSRFVKLAAQLDDPISTDKPIPQEKTHSALDHYQQQSSFEFLFGMPLKHNTRAIGYLLAESTPDIQRSEFVRGLSIVVPAAVSSLQNAFQYDSVPFRGLWGRLPLTLIRGSKFVLGTAIVLLTFAALWFIETDFKVRIEGELRPVEQQFVFAPHDGIVERVAVRHGDSVTSAQTLLEIRSPELELAVATNRGETEKLTTLLDAKKIALNQAASDNSASPAIIGQLSSDISDVEYQLKSLADEQVYLKQQKIELTLASPISGTVITWNVAEMLLKKPVRWGDSLIQIADEQGQWELRFLVPERRLGYLLAARQRTPGEPMKVCFFFESNPVNKFRSTVREIGNSTQRDGELGTVTLLIAQATDGDYVKRHGAKVIADVDCGKKSILYVWTHQWVDSIRRRLVW